MDRIETRNLLLNPKLIPNVLIPLGYSTSTFRVICEVVEAAVLYEQRKGKARLVEAVKQLKLLDADLDSRAFRTAGKE